MKELKLDAVIGFNTNGTTREQLTSFPYDNTNQNIMGRPITKKFAQKLIAKSQWKNNDPSRIVSVTFDSSAIILLLSQPGCVGVRYYYAMKENNVETMVLCGIDKNGHDLGVKDPGKNKKGSIINDLPAERECAILLEVGGGNKITDFG